MSDDAMVENRTFAEIEVGQSASLSRTLTKTELEGFAAVSGDFNPTHLNETYARAHGLRAAAPRRGRNRYWRRPGSHEAAC